MKKKGKVKIGKIIGNPDAPINDVVRHMRSSELTMIESSLDRIRGVMAMVFHMADENLLGESSKGLTTVLDNTMSDIDELRRRINGETEEEERERFEKERKAA